jgi:hypothetical protein
MIRSKTFLTFCKIIFLTAILLGSVMVLHTAMTLRYEHTLFFLTEILPKTGMMFVDGHISVL